MGATLASRDRQTYVSRILISAERTVDAPADAVYRYIADMREHHPRFLPPAFSDFRVESGGVGAGTTTRFKVTTGWRTREYQMKVAEPEPGRILTESNTGSSLVTTYTVSPQGGASLVQISTAWKAASGIGGLFERIFAPRVMRAIYADELNRLDAYAREIGDGTTREALTTPASLTWCRRSSVRLASLRLPARRSSHGSVQSYFRVSAKTSRAVLRSPTARQRTTARQRPLRDQRGRAME